MIDIEDFRKENKNILNEIQEKFKGPQNQRKELQIPRKGKLKSKEYTTPQNLNEKSSWKWMLEFFKIPENFNEKNTPQNTSNNFCSYNIQKVKNSLEKRISGLVVFLSDFEVYIDIVHAKLIVNK